MKILFDHQVFSVYKYGGVSRYFVELTRELRKINHTETELSCSFSYNEVLLDSHLYPVKPFFRDHPFKGRGRLLSYINKPGSKSKIRQAAFDIFHPTYYDYYFLSDLGKKPFVVTCHDLIHEKFTDRFPTLTMDRLQSKGKKEILEKADRIIAVSHNTKKDILEHYSVDPDKIRVIHLAHQQSTIFSLPGTGKELPGNYFLYVGNRDVYKNFLPFLEAIAPILKKNKDLTFLCAGGGDFSVEERHTIHRLDIRDQVSHTGIDSRGVDALYRNALAFFFPSLYEGFGIPVLEALSNGCPAVLSNTSSLPEVAGEAALYFDPSDPASMYKAAVAILDNGTLRQHLQKTGPERAALFSWKKCALETYNLYGEL